MENQTEGAFLPADPRKLLHNGNFAKIPMLIGYNSDEGLIKQVFSGASDDPVDFTEYVPSDLNPNNSSELKEAIAEEIRDYYVSRGYDNDKMQLEIDLFTDIHILYGVFTSLKARLAASRSPVYFYRFSMSSKMNFVKSLNPKTQNRPGASHADDLFYLFNAHSLPAIEPGSLEDRCIERMVRLWTNFAKYGNPTPKAKLDGVINVEWPLATREEIKYLEIANDRFDLGKDPEKERMEFWDRLYEKYFKH